MQLNINKDIYIYLDFFRWVSAFLVMIGHIRSVLFVDFDFVNNKNLITRFFYFITGLGHEAVIIFFVLSGLLIGTKIITAHQNDEFCFSKYIIDRICRIYVVLVPALLLTYALDLLGYNLFNVNNIYTAGYEMQAMLFNANEHLSFTIFIGNLFMLQNLFVPSLGTNGPLWSLNYEFYYYLVFPIIIIAYFKRTFFYNFLVFISLLLMIYLKYEIVLYMFIWLIGIIPSIVILKNYTNSFTKILSIIIFVILIIISRIHILPIILCDFMIAISFVFLLINLGDYKLKYQKIHKSLSDMSYSNYLIHFPLLIIFISFLQKIDFIKVNQLQPNIYEFLLFILIIFIISICTFIFNLLFEKKTNNIRLFLYKIFNLKSKDKNEA